MQATSIQSYYNQRWLLDTLSAQLADMKRVYPTLNVNPVKFKNPAHDTTYRRLSEVYTFIANVKESEWHMMTERIRQREESKGVQAAMF